MDIQNSEMFYTGIFFLLMLLSGFWVSRSGKPYNSFIFNIHKFIGLGIGYYLIRTVYLANQATPLNGLQWAAIIVTILLFIVAVLAGGFLGVLAEGGLKNMAASMRNVVSLVHKFSPYLIMVATGLTLYLLLFR